MFGNGCNECRLWKFVLWGNGQRQLWETVFSSWVDIPPACSVAFPPVSLHLYSGGHYTCWIRPTLLQYSCLENPMGGGAWEAAVPGVAKSWTQLSDFTFSFPFHVLEKEMATHSSVLSWRIPGTGEPGGLPSMGSHRVGHDWSDLAAAAAAGRVKIVYISQ